ncbi:MAG: NADPH-dependent glutamate synthase [Desulfovibrionaceae bacterium]|nr:NADPH-dependent glutamate synthase [Desulfovibrionaceae bacterium]
MTETPKAKKTILPRVDMPCQDPLERRGNFKEVALGYTREMAMREAARCLQCKKPKCIAGCPVEVPIKEFIAEVAKGNMDEAYRIIKTTNSLPAVCGRVCPQEIQCEEVCVLSAKGQPVCIGRLERYVADQYIAANPCAQVTGTNACAVLRPGLKAACIGSGPASITAAGYLASQGVAVDVYEALHEPGGVLVYGIPAFRLPKDIVAEELNGLSQLGVTFLTNWVGGRTVTVAELLEQGYQAVFIGVGAGLPMFLRVPGENLIGVFSANEYLTRVNLGRAYAFPDYDTPVFPGRNVTVFGAGNVAMDAARTALRLGAESVHIVYRRTRDEMPARHEEIEHAEEEGIRFELLAAPLKFNGDAEMRLESVSLQRMRLGEPDSSGRRRPEPIEGAFYELPTDLAIVALGTNANPILLEATPGLERNKWGYIVVNEETGETSIPNVFAGGDIVTGAATVILAMGAGRRAAQEIARRLLKP